MESFKVRGERGACGGHPGGQHCDLVWKMLVVELGVGRDIVPPES